MQKTLESGSFEESGGNANLLRSVIASSPDNSTGEEILQRYNQQKLVIGSALKPATDEFGLKAGKDFAEQLLKGSAGKFTTISVTKKDGKTEPIPYQEFIDRYGEEIYTEDGKIKEQYSVMSTKTDGSDGYTPGFKFKTPDGAIISFDAPPAYNIIKRPITELAQAFHNPSGEGSTNGLPGFYLDPVNPMTGEVLYQDWSNSKMKLKVDYVPDGTGNLRPQKTLYEQYQAPGAPEAEWRKAQYKYYDNQGNIQSEDLPFEIVNTKLNKLGLEKSFTTTQDTQNASYREDAFGNKINIYRARN